MRVIIEKHERRLTVFEGEREVFRCRAALGREPEGPKQREGDGRTPEGVYVICLVKERGKYGRSLGLSYPGIRDAQEALLRGRSTGLRFSLWTRPIARAGGPMGIAAGRRDLYS